MVWRVLTLAQLPLGLRGLANGSVARWFEPRDEVGTNKLETVSRVDHCDCGCFGGRLRYPSGPSPNLFHSLGIDDPDIGSRRPTNGL